MKPPSSSKTTTRKQAWIDWTWTILYLVLLGTVTLGPWTERLCPQMGVDFRGYYASGQIARSHGFAAVYDQTLQREYQADLLYRCPSPVVESPLYVAMPYLPLFVILFLPFTYLPFTTGYLLWVVLQLGLYFFTLRRFSNAFVTEKSRFRILQWGLGIPLIANLYLGQINALLVFILSEFILAFTQNRRRASGAWLSALLIKPHTLILILPGLVLSQNWPVLLTFGLGATAIFGSSLLLGGLKGLTAISTLTYQFAGPLIQNPAGMMNWRALGLNLDLLLPSWLAWLLAGAFAILITWLVLRQWWKTTPAGSTLLIGLVGIIILGTFIVSWHSHFYMHMLLVPLLLVVDRRGLLPQKLRLLWLLGPPLVYLAAHLAVPALEGRLFGSFMLFLNVFLIRGFLQLVKNPVS